MKHPRIGDAEQLLERVTVRGKHRESDADREGHSDSRSRFAFEGRDRLLKGGGFPPGIVDSASRQHHDEFVPTVTRAHVVGTNRVFPTFGSGRFNGLHLGILARQARPDVRLVFISGWDDPVLRRDAAELGALYLQKPIRAAELLAA